MLSISGLPYDTLHEVIGIVPNDSSLKSFGVNYEQIDLVNDDFDYEKIHIHDFDGSSSRTGSMYGRCI